MSLENSHISSGYRNTLVRHAGQGTGLLIRPGAGWKIVGRLLESGAATRRRRASRPHERDYMASNLTSQVRNIASVATAVAKGDLSQKITVGARGEILAVKSTVNTISKLREADRICYFATTGRETGFQQQTVPIAPVKSWN